MGEEKTHKYPIRDPSSPVSSAGKPIFLQQAVEFISSLISLSHSIKIFSAKWKSIGNKLEELNSGLFAAANCDNSHENPEISALIPSIMETTKDCHDLARRCIDFSFSGKLLMQSNLDVITAKFDRHVKTLSDIYNTGILTQRFAIVVSKPCLGASKDDMRFYVTDILTRMKIGGTEMKKQALINLRSAIIGDEKYVKLIFEINDIVNLLINFIDFPEVEIQEEASKVVSLLSGFDYFKSVMVGAGVISPLIRVLESGSDLSKIESAKSLQKLTESSDNAWSVSSHGGVTVFLKICSNVDSKPELICYSCGVLRNLVPVEEIKRFMVEEGAISTFIKLIRSKDEGVQINSIGFLQNIVFGDESGHNLIVKEGGIRALVRVFDPKSSVSSKTREIALWGIENLCFNSMSYLNILMNYGFLDHLHYFLKNGEVSLQELVLKVAFKLCGISEEMRKVMGDKGFMQELVKFLAAKSLEMRQIAAEALLEIVSVPKNRKRFVQDENNISMLLKMLDPDEGNSSGNKRLLLGILNSLTGCNSGRRKIVSSGYVKNIEKLAEDQVSDAKKLVRKLSTNRFRTLLGGIWHS